jgi:hypothetical protein
LLDVTINAGIGDIIHCHAMLEAEQDAARVAVNHTGLHEARNPRHSEFADLLTQFVFYGPSFQIVPQMHSGGATPQALRAAGVAMAAPDLRGVLPIPGVPAPPTPFVAVATKVRGWRVERYLAIRERFLAELERIAERMPVVLVGERVLTKTPEYHGHGEGFAYSIYEDLRGLPCIDATFASYGQEPAQWDQFRIDCTTMAHARLVVVLGTGGNCSMAMACGQRMVCLTDQTEMGEYFHAMPADERIRLCESDEAYLAAMREETDGRDIP